MDNPSFTDLVRMWVDENYQWVRYGGGGAHSRKIYMSYDGMLYVCGYLVGNIEDDPELLIRLRPVEDRLKPVKFKNRAVLKPSDPKMFTRLGRHIEAWQASLEKAWYGARLTS